MRRAILAAALSSLLSVAAGGEEPVYFADVHLKVAVEAELWVVDPTPTDMLGLIHLIASQRDIRSLVGLEYALNIQTLDLSFNSIKDVAPLAGLGNLWKLVLNNNQIGNVAPLAGLTGLRHLDVHSNRHLADISALSGLSNVETLILRLNQVEDIAPLAGLTNLEELELQWNDVADISPLSGLIHLRRVQLQYNQVEDIAPLAALTSLERLDLRGNPLKPQTCDVYLPLVVANNPGIDLRYDPCVEHYRLVLSSTAGGAVVAPGEGRFFYENGQIVYVEARADAGCTFVGWSGSISDSENPLYLLMHQNLELEAVFAGGTDEGGGSGSGDDGTTPHVGELILAAIAAAGPDAHYVDDDAANDPGPGDPGRSDPKEDGTATHPFDTIREAIDAAFDGDAIVVRPGTYRENINLRGRRIHLIGFDPDGPPLADLPVIDGGGAGPVVSFTGGEDPNCMVVGFVITGGRSREAAAILCAQSNPVVAHCLIVGNRTTDSQGAAVRCIDSQAVFVNCTLADNAGGGIMLFDPPPVDVVLTNSIVWGNGAAVLTPIGVSTPAITHSDVAGSWPGTGNIDADPLFVRRGYWADPANLEVAAEPDDANAIWVTGDYHLRSQAGRWDPDSRQWVRDAAGSPCLDAGDPAGPVGLEPVPNGGVINLGAYGGTMQAAKSLE